MQVKIIGAHGGVTRGYHATSILIDDKLLIDAGSAASSMDIQAQVAIESVLISHAHLDHTKDLGFLCDNCFGLRPAPFQVYTHKTVKNAIKAHLFNDVIWPDFSVLPTKNDPCIIFNEIEEEKELQLGEYTVLPIHVKHPGDAYGFVVTKGNVSIVFTQDTGPTERIWEVAKKVKNLRAIFTEVSFPNKLQNIAELSDHHTPQSMKKEIEKMPDKVPIYLGHLKPNYQEELIQEITDLKNSRLHILYADDVRFNFD
ncbi:3',5'-cyclic-nucleotide phosphodiesterase [Bacteriovoracaceae bacterium]|nr:3',5'-cyclic-nucleotide phosphodiesterase [Bacteriovoracaceae bacterium]